MDLLTVIIFGFVVGLLVFLAKRLRNWLQSRMQPTSVVPMPEQPIPAQAEHSSSSEPSTAIPHKTGAESIQEFLTQTACQIDTEETRDEWIYHIFLYQGAYFESYSNNTTDEVLLYYHWGVPYSRENFAWVQRFCNHLSNQSRYVRTTYRYDSENDKFDVVLHIGAMNPTVTQLRLYIHCIFDVARELLFEYDHRDERTDEDIIENMRSRTLFLRCQQYNEPIRIMANYKHFNAQCLSINQMLKALFDSEQVEDLLSMTIVSEQGTMQITQRNKIALFDVFSTIVKKLKGGQLEVSTTPVAITIDSTFSHYTFTLHLVEQTSENIFIRLTAMKVPYDHLQTTMPDQVYTPESVSCLLCYETSNEHSFETFGHQMEQARQARRDGAELTDEQYSLLQLTEGNLEYQLLEGRRLANHGRYLQAIALLEPAYHRLSQKDNELIQSRYDKTIDAAYHLGRCYYHLNLFNKAYFYIHTAYKSNRLDASYLYFQLLYHTKDIYLLEELSEEKRKMEKNLQDMAKRAEILTEDEQLQYNHIRDYYLFLYKLHAEIMIREERYELAYNDLDYLLQYEHTQEYAQAKIDELDKINPDLQ